MLPDRRTKELATFLNGTLTHNTPQIAHLKITRILPSTPKDKNPANDLKSE